MDKIRVNLTKAIEEKTKAWQRLSVKDILDLVQATKIIWDMGEKVELTKDGIAFTKGKMPTLYDDNSIGFGDWGDKMEKQYYEKLQRTKKSFQIW